MNGGEMFTHLYQRQHFKEAEVRVYGGEIVLALEHLHKVGAAALGRSRGCAGRTCRGSDVSVCARGLWMLACGSVWECICVLFV